MGVAAYNRGSLAISRDIDAHARAPEFCFMDHLNSLPKAPNAPKPWGPVQFVNSHGGWWAECPTTGYGFFYKTLRTAVCAWAVDVVGYENGMWKAIPRTKS